MTVQPGLEKLAGELLCHHRPAGLLGDQDAMGHVNNADRIRFRRLFVRPSALSRAATLLELR